MKKRIISLCLVVALLFALTTTVSAIANTITAQLTYRDIKITLNDKVINSKDASGKTIEPFIMDGTTYLPVRAVAEALGLDVNWDPATSTVALTEPSPVVPGTVIIDNDLVKITLTRSIYAYDLSPDVFAVDFCVENKTDKKISFYVGDCSINSYMGMELVSGQLGITPGCSSNITVRVYNEAPDVKSVDDITKFLFYIKISDYSSWDYLFMSDLINFA